jgi:hypothetical protein
MVLTGSDEAQQDIAAKLAMNAVASVQIENISIERPLDGRALAALHLAQARRIYNAYPDDEHQSSRTAGAAVSRAARRTGTPAWLRQTTVNIWASPPPSPDSGTGGSH